MCSSVEAHILTQLCGGALLHRHKADPWPSGGGSQAATPTQQAGSAEQQQQPEEGPQQAWQHMKADMQDPHDWDRRTEQEYERAAQRRALHTLVVGTAAHAQLVAHEQHEMTELLVRQRPCCVVLGICVSELGCMLGQTLPSRRPVRQGWVGTMRA